jgi:hypothetical protein
MNRTLVAAAPAALVALLLASAPASAQVAQQDTTTPPPARPVFYGGSIILGFGAGFRIGAFPLVGVQLNPRLAVGAQAGVEYVNYDDPGGDAVNYGGALFTRFRVNPRLYLHGEGQYINYELPRLGDTSDREWVPFVLVGGGLVQPLSGRSAAYVEVLFDVLQHDDSPYDDWEPVVRVGVSVGY